MRCGINSADFDDGFPPIANFKRRPSTPLRAHPLALRECVKPKRDICLCVVYLSAPSCWPGDKQISQMLSGATVREGHWQLFEPLRLRSGPDIIWLETRRAVSLPSIDRRSRRRALSGVEGRVPCGPTRLLATRGASGRDAPKIK